MARLVKLEALRKQLGKSHQAIADAVQDYLRKELVNNVTDITPLDLKKASYKRTTYTMLENGYVKNVAPHIIEALAAVFGVSVEEMQEICINDVDIKNRESLMNEVNVALNLLSDDQLTAVLNLLLEFKK
uniref:PROTEIN (SINR PROTEIN) REGULATOR, ANTAGONIST, SPORULATION.9A n=1 Tax=Myoviridae sp. ctFPV8 TaxID=2825068 RepID=A0A8S5PCF2_9CAUD|nr:MAG TPA: PROTEIN (SINR PROTEIN) REGULATOR, ANTAGONIST, SPORULATION.9A [Myoviridae sp. ctFPV8]